MSCKRPKRIIESNSLFHTGTKIKPYFWECCPNISWTQTENIYEVVPYFSCIWLPDVLFDFVSITTLFLKLNIYICFLCLASSNKRFSYPKTFITSQLHFWHEITFPSQKFLHRFPCFYQYVFFVSMCRHSHILPRP